MQVRNPPLLALGLVLLAASAALGSLLVHDAEVGGPDWAASRVGDEVRAKGDLARFQLAFTRTAHWASVTPLLENVTYVLENEEGVLVLVTSPVAAETREGVVVEGIVLLAGPHPDDPARRLVLIEAGGFHAPLLFR